MAPEKENFELTGPSFLTIVDWQNSHHRRSIAACLVQGVYTLERDRQQNRQGPQALAPPWWEFFNFRLIQILVDENDMSYFGAIYEFNLSSHSTPLHKTPYSTQTPPQYIIAFRGIDNNKGTRAQDLKLDLHVITNNLRDSKRFKIGMDLAQQILSRVRPESLWLAGHSEGSSISLLIGRTLAKEMGIHIETYLFNPPFTSIPIKHIKNEKIEFGMRFANSFLIAILAVACKGCSSKKAHEDDQFVALSTWIPYLFVNSLDLLCAEYIGYFEHREMMESVGAGKIGKLATRHSVSGFVSHARGKESEATHLIPSAYLTINSNSEPDLKKAHGIHQWWNPHFEFNYKLYQYT